MTCPDCSAHGTIADLPGHRRFHDLVEQQTGQRRADLPALMAARGHRTPTPHLPAPDRDPALSAAARQAGERAARNAEDVQDWNARARAAVLALAATGEPFTSEDVTERVGLPRVSVGTNRNNAVGALLSGAARRGIIAKTGRMVPSSRVSSHGAALAEWVGASRDPERTHR